jgi:glycosyltransferase involved in cell wall biosynthesis
MLLARELTARGHEVEVLTGFPNYPGGKIYAGYRVRLWAREKMEGISVLRVALYPSHDRSAFGRILNYLSFAASAAVIGAALIRKPNVMYVYHPPATAGLAAVAIRFLRRVPFVYDVMDLWPDTVATSGMMSNPTVIMLLDRMCKWIYRNAGHIAVVSPGFKQRLVDRGVVPEKIDIIYNWCDEANMGGAAERHGTSSKTRSDKFTVLFAGTMGTAQGLDTALEAARICGSSVPNAHFQFVGGGIDRERLEQKAAQMGLDNVTIMPWQPVNRMGPILAAADVLLVHLKDDPLFRITIPSKTQAYFVAGKPVLMAVSGDSAQLVRDAGAGIIVPPDDCVAMAEAVRQFSHLTPAEREEMGENGRRYYQTHMSLKTGVDRFESLFRLLGN